MIDEILKKHEIVDYRLYRISKLYDLLTDIGLINMKRSGFTTNFINRKANQGKLELPRKGAFDRHYLTGKQIRGIVLAFIPGGKGSWSYKEELVNESDLRKS
jgi:hypothetical protein